jgi:hypothetical protein
VRVGDRGRASGFAYILRGDREVLITHHGRAATTLRGRRADSFLAELASGDAQELMARYTGQYRRDNERTAKDHPRNRT